MIAVASRVEKCRCCVAYRTSVEYRTAKPSVAKIWMKKSTPVPSGRSADLVLEDGKILSREQHGTRLEGWPDLPHDAARACAVQQIGGAALVDVTEEASVQPEPAELAKTFAEAARHL